MDEVHVQPVRREPVRPQLRLGLPGRWPPGRGDDRPRTERWRAVPRVREDGGPPRRQRGSQPGGPRRGVPVRSEPHVPGDDGTRSLFWRGAAEVSCFQGLLGERRAGHPVAVEPGEHGRRGGPGSLRVTDARGAAGSPASRLTLTPATGRQCRPRRAPVEMGTAAPPAHECQVPSSRFPTSMHGRGRVPGLTGSG